MLGTEKTIISVDCYDVEQLIKKIYGHQYEIMPMEEVGSSQYAATYTQLVEKRELEFDEPDSIKALKDGKPNQYCLNAILCDMCNNGHIAKGEYIIEVNW